MELSKNKASVEHRSRSIANIVDSVSMIVSVVFRELKQRRRRRQRERQKSNKFRFAKQHLCTCIMLFCTLLSPWIIDTRLQKCGKAYVCFGKWKSRLQFFLWKEASHLLAGSFFFFVKTVRSKESANLKAIGEASWIVDVGMYTLIFLSERDAGVRWLKNQK